jgi:AcrR family transcriptional regulator
VSGVVYDSAATRRRLIEAAVFEFSEYGVMGARVDRIAERAQANKRAIYMYFESKEGLFAAAFEDRIRDFHESVRFDESDLAGYAGRLFDKFEDAPDTRRMTLWYHLEQSVAHIPVPLIQASTRSEIEAIRRAQVNGIIPTTYEPATLLGLIRSIALTWHTQVPQLHDAKTVSRDEKRRVIEQTVHSLLSPPA